MKTKIIITIFFFVISLSAHGALVSRLGGLAVYDTDLDITWLADANAGAGSVFDDGILTTDGRMTWENANAWAASLTVGGFTDWRLPTALNSDGTGPCTGLNCTDSEMGHLFYNELSGASGSSIFFINDPDLALFSNVQLDLYWSAPELGPELFDDAWFFSVVNGIQLTSDKRNLLLAWAVHSGDVGVIPVPAAVWLFGSGLIGLLGFKRHKH